MINLLWTFRVDRGNPDVAAKLKEAIELRSAGRGVLPTTLGDERRYNAFMRLPSFVGAAPQTDGGSQEQMEVATLAYLRGQYDCYSPTNEEYAAACAALGVVLAPPRPPSPSQAAGSAPGAV